MKIIFFSCFPLDYGGGTAKYFIETASNLQKRFPEITVAIVTFDETLFKRILFMYSVYFLRKQGLTRKKDSSRSPIKKIKDVPYIQVSTLSSLSKEISSSDRVYTTNNLVEVLLFRFLAIKIKLPKTIYGFHIPIHYPFTHSLQDQLHNRIYGSFFYRYLLNRAFLLHTINMEDTTRLKKMFPHQKIRKISNPFHFAEYKKLGIREIKHKKNSFTILWVGRITPQKGVHDLTRLITTINATPLRDQINWQIAGDGELRDDIIRLTRTWKNVHYHGYIPNRDLPQLYKAADLYIHTSHWEGFPYTLLEAQSFGLPSLCYNIPGCRDIIENGKNGYLVDTYSRFEKKLISLCTSPMIHKKRVLQTITSKFDQEKLYSQLYTAFLYAK